MKCAVTFLGILAVPLSAIAEERALPASREECTPLYTVQKRHCRVENVWRCETSEGVFYLNETFGPDGEIATYSDDDYFQVAQAPLKKNVSTRKGDRFSLSELRANGADKIEERGEMDLLGTGSPMRLDVQGEARLSGETLTIPGTVADHFQVRLLGRVGKLKYVMTSQAYIDRETGTVFGGVISEGMPSRQNVTESQPVSLIREGEEGFLAEHGIYGCEGESG